MRLEYQISATGVNQVKRVLRSVEQEQTASNMRAVNASTKMWARQLAAVKREIARTEARGIRTRGAVPTGKGAAGTAAATRATEMADRRAHTRRLGQIASENRAKVRGVMTEQAQRQAAARLGDTDAARAHAMRLEQIATEGRARILATKRATRAQTRDENYRHRLKLRNIERERAREISALTRARVTRERAAAGRGAAIGGAVTRSVGGALGGIGRTVAGLGALGGGFAAFGAVRDEMQVAASASQLANKALGTPGETRDRQQIRSDVIKQSRSLGASTGLGAQGIIAALDKFTAISGRLGLGQQLAPFMADIADATGAAIEDVGRTSGQIVQAMMARGMDEPEALAQTKEIMAAMMAQAKVGSIEFADLATQMGKVMSSTAAFDGKVSDLTTTMGAISQLAIAGAASSPEEAMTAILRFRDDLIQNADRFKKQGINVFADKSKTRLRNPEELMLDMLKKTGGSLPKVSKLFGIRAAKAVTPFQALYTEKGGGEAGIAAVRALLENAKATIPQTEVAQSAAFRRREDDKKMAMAAEKFNAAVGTHLLPVLTELIPKFTDLIPSIGKATESFATVANWAIENPFQGLGALVAAKVGADLASAGVKAAAAKGFEKVFASIGKGGALGIGSLAVATIAGGIMVQQAAWARIETSTAKSVEQETGRGESVLDTARRELDSQGFLSPETKQRVEKLRAARVQQREEGTRAIKEGGGFWGAVEGGVQTITSLFGSEELQKKHTRMAGATSEELTKQETEATWILEQAKIMSTSAEVSKATAEMNAKTADTIRSAADTMKKAADAMGGTDGNSKDGARRNSPVLNRGG